MKKFFVLLSFLSTFSFAQDKPTGFLRDCVEADKCKFKDCVALVSEQIGSEAISTCREVHKLVNGKYVYAYTEVKTLNKLNDDKTQIATTVKIK